MLEDGVTSRRRRRRRRGDQDLELTGGGDDDPPNTVTRVRAPRAAAEAPVNNRVTSVKGSTRLEAKKQRRRESRDAGRRRTVSPRPSSWPAANPSTARWSSARRRQNPDRRPRRRRPRRALRGQDQDASLIGNVYLGKVQNVLPTMEAAFVDIGRGRNAVLYAGEVDWDAAAEPRGQPGASHRARAEARRQGSGPGHQRPGRSQGRPSPPARSRFPAATSSTCPTVR